MQPNILPKNQAYLLWNITCENFHSVAFNVLNMTEYSAPNKNSRLGDFYSTDCIDTIYPTPPLGQDMTQGQFLSRV